MAKNRVKWVNFGHSTYGIFVDGVEVGQIHNAGGWDGSYVNLNVPRVTEKGNSWNALVFAGRYKHLRCSMSRAKREIKPILNAMPLHRIAEAAMSLEKKEYQSLFDWAVAKGFAFETEFKTRQQATVAE